MSKREIVVDSFAGGGGASLGIAQALRRAPDYAINHDEHALALHARNHPSTKHVCEDVWRADFRKLVGGKKVGLLWASPDCKDFSRAKGDTPRSKEIRSLAWVVVKWAHQVGPRVIILENVREFAEWSPLVPKWTCQACAWKGTEGQTILARTRRRCPRCDSLRLKETTEQIRDPNKKGLIFKRWVGRLRNLGYRVEWKNLDAADYGAPTHRKRLFLIARNDGQFIFWPEPTHGDHKKKSPAIHLKPYRTAAECIDWSIPCPSIFDPVARKEAGLKAILVEKTLRRVALGCKRYVLEDPNPYIVVVNHGGEEFRGQAVDLPLSTVTAKHGYGLVTPFLSPWLAKHYGGVVGHDLKRPIGTITAIDHHGLAAAHLVKFRGDSDGKSLNEPMPTITSGAGAARPAGAAHAMGIAAAYLARFNFGEKQWNGVNEPLPTITSQPNKFGLCYAFLVKFFGTAIARPLDEPMDTQTGKHRFALVTVEVSQGMHEPAVAVFVNGIGWCVIADIGLRMLSPRELARAQGFPDTYEMRGPIYRQVSMIGNSVCPPIAKALVEANYVGNKKKRGARACSVN